MSMGGGSTETKREIPDQTEVEKELENLLAVASRQGMDLSNAEVFNRLKSSIGNTTNDVDWNSIARNAANAQTGAADLYTDRAKNLYNQLAADTDRTSGRFIQAMGDATDVYNNAQSHFLDDIKDMQVLYSNALDSSNSKYENNMLQLYNEYKNSLNAANNRYRTDQGKTIGDWNTDTKSAINDYASGMKNVLGTYSDNMQDVINAYSGDTERALNTYTGNMRNYLGSYADAEDAALAKYNADIGGVSKYWQDLVDGKLPESFATHRQAALNADLEGTVGNSFNNLANRGIINSAVTNKAMDDISQNASDTLAKMWSNDMALEADLLKNRETNIQSIYNNSVGSARNKFDRQSATENGIYGNTSNYLNNRLNAQSDYNKTFLGANTDYNNNLLNTKTNYLNTRLGSYTDYNNNILGNATNNANNIFSNAANALANISANERSSVDNKFNAAQTVYNNQSNAYNNYWDRKYQIESAINGNGQSAAQTIFNAGSGLAQNAYQNTANANNNYLNNYATGQAASFQPTNNYMSLYNNLNSMASNLYNTMYSGRMGTGSTTTTQDDGGAGMWSAMGSLGAAMILNPACFTGDTLVATPTGYKYIKDIHEDDLVLSIHNGELAPKKVAYVNEPHEANIVNVYFNNSTVWHTTSFQRLYDGKHFHSLQVGAVGVNNDLLPRTVIRIVDTGEKETVYDFAVEGFAGENVFFANDIAAEGFGE